MVGPAMSPCYVFVKGSQKCAGEPAVRAGELGLLGKLELGGDGWAGVDEWQHWVGWGGSQAEAHWELGGLPWVGESRAGDPRVFLPSEWMQFVEGWSRWCFHCAGAGCLWSQPCLLVGG